MYEFYPINRIYKKETCRMPTLTPDERTQRRKAREQAKMQSRKAGRATYDLPPELRERIRSLAKEQGLPASQLVTFALLRFLRDYARGDAPLAHLKEPSRSPRYDWNLVIEGGQKRSGTKAR
jgi:hypothetical protein